MIKAVKKLRKLKAELDKLEEKEDDILHNTLEQGLTRTNGSKMLKKV